MNERPIILVRHSKPNVSEHAPASAWPLSDDGMRQARELAARLHACKPGRVVTSTERKAIETGQVIASQLGIDLVTDELLNEQGRGTVPFLADGAAFLALVHDHFRFPDQAILGNEPASHAADRLEAAINDHSPTGHSPVIFVSHGRVLASYLARLSRDEAWTIWESMTMPDAYMIERDASGHVVRIAGT